MWLSCLAFRICPRNCIPPGLFIFQAILEVETSECLLNCFQNSNSVTVHPAPFDPTGHVQNDQKVFNILLSSYHSYCSDCKFTGELNNGPFDAKLHSDDLFGLTGRPLNIAMFFLPQLRSARSSLRVLGFFSMCPVHKLYAYSGKEIITN